MSGELDYVQHPWRSRIRWTLVYVLIIASLVIIAYLTIGRIRTYSLPTGGVQLSVPYTRYLVGETVSFSVRNNYDSSIFVANGCPAEPLSVYKYANNTWTRIHDKTDIQNCHNQERSVEIPAHTNLTATFADWPHLFNSPGKYRIALQVQYYDAVPYQDFEVVAKPKAKTASSNNGAGSTGSQVASTGQSGSIQAIEKDEGQVNENPQTYTVYVNAAGNYSVTSLSLRIGDAIKFVYQAPYQDEVRTIFTPLNGTDSGVSSVTVDQEYTSRTRQFTQEGTWSFRAADHNGNTGVVRVDD